MKELYNQRFISTANPKHFIYHTLAHIVHDINDHNSYTRNNAWEFYQDEIKLIEKKVSKIGATEINNFISEVFVGTLEGRNTDIIL